MGERVARDSLAAASQILDSGRPGRTFQWTMSAADPRVVM